MYNSIIATDMFTLKGANDIERMDDIQLADLGIERKGNVFLRDSKVIHEIARFDLRAVLNRVSAIVAPGHLRSARV